jgi:uncharacterized spore protein YtfJ
MTQIINGGLQNVKSQTIICMAITSAGTELSSGVQIFPNDVATVKSQTIQALAVDSNGNALQ